MRVRIRPATVDDVAELVQVHYTTWKDTYPRLVESVTLDDVETRFMTQEGGLKGHEARWADTITNKQSNHRVFLAENDDKIVGFVLPSIREDDAGYIKALYVLPDAQGSGVGRKLLKRSLEWMKADTNPVYLTVVTTNPKAINLYKSYGFEITGKPEWDGEGIRMDEYEMIRKAGPL